MKKIKVLVVPSDRFGVGYYRSVNPHVKLNELYKDEFDITIDYSPNFNDLSSFDNYDIIHIHKGLFTNMESFKKALKYFKEKNIVTVLDLDDYWECGQYHPNYVSNVKSKIPQLIIDNIKSFDYVTTTTPIFAKEIEKYNKNVKVIPNAIDPNEKQFIPKDTHSDKLRVGLILGSSHKYDVKLLEGMTNKLSKDILEKVQFVLCGFDLRGTMKMIGKDGTISERPLKPTETVWYEYEKILTDNYRLVSPQYKEFLNKFIPNSEYPDIENEHYRRCWTKDITEYATHYNNIDVLLCPLKECKFNEMKSQLKVIEAGMFHKAIIASDFGPYQLDLIPAIEKGGIINPKGNALIVESRCNHKDWTRNIERLAKNPDLLKQIRENLYDTVKNKYNLNYVAKDRADFYKAIFKK